MLCTCFSLSLSLANRHPGLCIDGPARVSACYYNNMLAMSRALSPSLKSFSSLSLCDNRKMLPPHRIWRNLAFFLILLLAGDVSLNPGPSVCGLCLGTVNARPRGIRCQLYRDLVTSNVIDLLGITETWLTARDTSADLAEMPTSPPPQVSPFFRNPEHSKEEWACSFLQPINLQRSVCRPKQVLSLCLVKLNVVRHALLSSTFIIHRVLLLSSVSYKIHCPTHPHSLMIWY